MEGSSLEETERDQKPSQVLRKKKSVLTSLNMSSAAYPSSTIPKSVPKKAPESSLEFLPECQEESTHVTDLTTQPRHSSSTTTPSWSATGGVGKGRPLVRRWVPSSLLTQWFPSCFSLQVSASTSSHLSH